MADKATHAAVLMSINPEFADKILSGDKRVEFRKSRFSKQVSHVILYATSPARRVVGAFEVRGIEEAPPEELWERHKHDGGIDAEGFWGYYASTKRACAIVVGTVFRLDPPAILSELEEGLTPPQSFRYVEEPVLDRILGAAIPVSHAGHQKDIELK